MCRQQQQIARPSAGKSKAKPRQHSSTTSISTRRFRIAHKDKEQLQKLSQIAEARYRVGKAVRQERIETADGDFAPVAKDNCAPAAAGEPQRRV